MRPALCGGRVYKSVFYCVLLFFYLVLFFLWWSQVSAIFFANSYAALALPQVSDKIMTFSYVSGSI